MKSRTLLLATLLLLLAGLLPCDAGIKIIKARYGRSTGTKDVSRVFDAYLRLNKLSFLINSSSMGCDPYPGQEKYLVVDYEVDGRRYRDTANDGDIFTFQGVPGLEKARPFLGFIPPAAPTVAPLRVTNQLGSTVLIYALDRYGRWQWEGELPPGQSYVRTAAAVGQSWKVTTRANEELQTVVIRAGGSVVTLAPPPPPVPAGFAQLRFDNACHSEAYLYTLDRWGAWDWVAKLDSGASYSARARLGDTWVATTRTGQVLRQMQIGPGMSVVRLGQ